MLAVLSEIELKALVAMIRADWTHLKVARDQSASQVDTRAYRQAMLPKATATATLDPSLPSDSTRHCSKARVSSTLDCDGVKLKCFDSYSMTDQLRRGWRKDGSE